MEKVSPPIADLPGVPQEPYEGHDESIVMDHPNPEIPPPSRRRHPQTWQEYREWLQQGWQAMLRFPRPLALYIFLYVAGESFGYAVQALFMISTLNLDPATLTWYWYIVGLNWYFTPVLGILQDSVQVCGYSRKPILVITAVLEAALWVVMTTATDYLTSLEIGIAISWVDANLSVAVNALVVQCTPPDDDGWHQSTYTAIRWAGTVAAAIWQIIFLANIDYRTTMGLACVFYGLAIPVVYWIHEDRRSDGMRVDLQDGFNSVENGAKYVSGEENGVLIPRTSLQSPAPTSSYNVRSVVRPRHTIREWLTTWWNMLKNPDILRCVIFIFMYNAAPTAVDAYYNYQYWFWYFSPYVYATFNLLGACGGVAGALFYYVFLAKRNIRTVFLWGSVMYILSSASNLLLVTGVVSDAQTFLSCENFYLSFFSVISTIPVLQLASEACPPGYEAFIFELFACVMFCGGSTSSAMSATATTSLGITNGNFNNLCKLMVICIGCRVGVTLFVFLLPTRIDKIEPYKDELPHILD